MDNIKEVYEFVKSKKLIENLIFIISCVLSLAITALIICFGFKPEPANDFDYFSLDLAAIEISNNPSILENADFQYTLHNDGTYKVITLENKKCKLIATYTMDYDYISCTRVDKSSIGTLPLIFIALALFVGFTFFIMIIILVSIQIILLKKKR